MPASNPQDLGGLLFQAIENQDLDLVMTLYEPEATFMPEPGQTVSGTDALTEVLGTFTSMGLSGEIETKFISQSGDIALMSSEWSLSGKDPEGNDLSFQGISWEVARQQEDGAWKYVIDNPWGNG
ncbi:MAG: nuclear transport factor 2 family protein [Chloroflexi bacterium]|nr:nuclear transport factor 2 family protein [Chloroflexota bacterium]